MKSIWILLIVSFCFFVENRTNAQKYTANTSLWVEWTLEAQMGEPYMPAYVARFQDGEKRLSYVAAFHDTSSTSETFQLIEHEFQTLDPEVVIVESSFRFSTEAALAYQRRIEAEGCRSECSYLVYLALKKGIPFWGGDPIPEEELAEWKKSPFSIQDIVGFYILRGIPSLARQGKSWTEEEYFLSCKRNIQEIYRIENFPFSDFKDFSAWYENKNGKKLVWDEVQTGEEAGPNAPFTQKLRTWSGRMRDAHNTTVIAEALNRYNRVLVVYGAGHFISQKPILAAMLGKPSQYFKLLNPKIVPALVEALKNKDLGVRIAAIHTLGLIGKDAAPALPALQDILKSIKEPGNTSEFMKAMIMESIGKINKP